MLPVILLVVDEDLKVLLKDLVHLFCLPVSFRMISCREVGLDAKQLTQRPPEIGDKVFPAVGDDVRRGSMPREDVDQERHSKILSINILLGHDK